jgi:hypothetical protein
VIQSHGRERRNRDSGGLAACQLIKRLVFLVDDLVRADGEENNRFRRKVGCTVTAGLFLVGEEFFALFADRKDDAEILINPFASEAPEVIPVFLFKGFGVVVGIFENRFNLLLNLPLQGSITLTSSPNSGL